MDAAFLGMAFQKKIYTPFTVLVVDLFQTMRRPFHYSDSILIDLETNRNDLTKIHFPS